MTKDEKSNVEKKTEGTRCLKRPKLEETNIPNPIQEQVKSPDKLSYFMKDVHDATVPKVWGIFLNKDYFSVGNESLAFGGNAEPEHFSTKGVAHFVSLFCAERFVILTNHLTDNATPTEEDLKLINRLEWMAKMLEVNFHDYVIVAGDHCWSMTVQNGKACHCGNQQYISNE